ncbi:MAG TPA: DUF1003 domain-containing protein [Candidatus Dormibacteraeota bacterium]
MNTTLEHLRHKKTAAIGHAHPVNVIQHDEATFGERVADRMSAGIGSWTFLIAQSVLIAFWITLNIIGLIRHWDPYPFFLLNFAFTLQAAFTGPVLLLAGKRQSEKDRLMLEHAAAEAEESEHRTIDILQETEENTEITLRILERVRQSRAGGAKGDAAS